MQQTEVGLLHYKLVLLPILWRNLNSIELKLFQ